jgi:hypothetical protein
MSAVLDNLIRGLDGDVQRQIRSRVDSMHRHLAFLFSSEAQLATLVRRSTWTFERLEILCELNSFYQIVLGPLASSARASQGQVLSNDVPIQFGDTILFDAARADRVNRAMADFMRRVRNLGIPQDVLTAAKADDLVRALGRLQGEEFENKGDDELPF